MEYDAVWFLQMQTLRRNIASIIRVKRISELETTLAETRVLQLIVTVNIPSSPILFTVMMAAHTSKTSVITRATRLNFPEDSFLHSHCCESLKSYVSLTDWAL
jgi:hypothetical protein